MLNLLIWWEHYKRKEIAYENAAASPPFLSFQILNPSFMHMQLLHQMLWPYRAAASGAHRGWPWPQPQCLGRSPPPVGWTSAGWWQYWRLMALWEIKGILEGSWEDDMKLRQPYCLRAFQAGDPLALSFLVCVKQAFLIYKVARAEKMPPHYTSSF